MGDTSQNCALTGLEICEGDAAYAVVLSANSDPYYGHNFKYPPIKGVYNGFSQIQMSETLIGLDTDECASGDTWPPEQHHRETVFIQAQVFEELESLPMAEWGGSLGEVIDNELAEVKEQPLGQHVRCWPGAFSHLIQERKIQKTSDECISLMRRSKLLKAAEYELRRPITITRRGPQHGGHNALSQMNKLVAGILAERIHQEQLELEEEELGRNKGKIL